MNDNNLTKKALVYSGILTEKAFNMTGEELVRSIYSPEELEKRGFEGPFKTEEEKQREFLEGVNSIPDSLVEGKTEIDIITEQIRKIDEKFVNDMKKLEERKERELARVNNMTGDELVRSIYSPEKLEKMGYNKIFKTDGGTKRELDEMLDDNAHSNNPETYNNGLGKK